APRRSLVLRSSLGVAPPMRNAPAVVDLPPPGYRKRSRRGEILLLRRCSIIALIAALAAVAAQGSYASSVVSTSDVKVISLGVNDQGQALVTYDQGGQKHQTVAWGAENAVAPAQGGKQVNFDYDYSGGYTLFKDQLGKAVD